MRNCVDEHNTDVHAPRSHGDVCAGCRWSLLYSAASLGLVPDVLWPFSCSEGGLWPQNWPLMPARKKDKLSVKSVWNLLLLTKSWFK